MTTHSDDMQQEQNTTLTRLDGRVGVLESGMKSLGVKIDTLAANVAASQRTNWPVLFTMASLMFVLVGGAWQLIDLKTQVALAPIQAQNAISTEERGTLARRIDENRGSVSTLSIDMGRMHEKTREIEQQFKRLGEAQNSFEAMQQRTNALMWNATEKLGAYPTGPYFFPNFSQHLPSP